MSRIIDAFTQFFDDDGSPLVSGWLHFLESGTNNTDKDTYADSGLTVPNTNPLQLDAAGRCPSVFGQGSYRVVLYTNDEVLNQPAVQIQQFDPVGGQTGTSQLDDWDSTTIYSNGDIVRIAPASYYRSIVNDNQGNNPETGASGFWEQIEFIRYWDTNVTYDQYDRVRIADGRIAISRINANIANNPETDRTSWTLEDINIFETSVTGAGTDTINSFVPLDSTGGSFTRTLPASPTLYDFVEYKDVGYDLLSNNITVSGGAENIRGLAQDFVLDINNLTIRFTYFGSTRGWEV